MFAIVRNVKAKDRCEWLRMRQIMWGDRTVLDHEPEMDDILASDADTVFVAERPGGGLWGVLEAGIRSCAIGCETRPVGHIEGWYADADMRRKGVGRALVGTAEAWAQANGCRQMASDTPFWNQVSAQTHRALGYERGCLELPRDARARRR